MTRITKEWRIQIGTNPDGSAQYRPIGYELEDDFGNGNKTTRLALCLDVLSPTLFALARTHVEKGSGMVIATRADFAKRYKAPSQAEAPAAESEPGDIGHED
jgi:hypothetical protein